MTQIIRGNLEFNELTKNSRGGTELMAERMANSIPKELLEPFQIIHSRVRELDPNLKKILVLHDLPNDPESAKLSDPSFRDKFEKIIFVSDWQLQMYNMVHGVPYSDSYVINNGIIPIEQHEKPDATKTLNLIYHTTPHRGLSLLIPVFEHLVSHYAGKIKLHLDVYSSFDIYGWGERNKPYEQLFHTCKHHPNITYHGSVSNDKIREALKKAHIFAYPSIWPETSCLAAIEAFSAKCAVVAPNYAGLVDTCSRWASSYQWDENHTTHAQTFARTLDSVIRDYINKSDIVNNQMEFQKIYFDTFYNWNIIKTQWEDILKELR